MQKSLDIKLAAIHADPANSPEFILADAKDGDMAFGVAAPGRTPDRAAEGFRSLEDYREHIRAITRQGLVDIMLMSASTAEQLVLQERLFDGSHVTPAARANDTSDIHVPRGGTAYQEASRPFRSASVDHIQCGRIECDAAERLQGVDLGLYSVTFNNDRDRDLETLGRFKSFREEAERKGFRYFLEVFAPNVPNAVAAELLPAFINDLIARTLAGVTQAGRPIFLKIPYLGPQAMEELARYDPRLIVGVLGGSAGTTLDAFQLLYEARRHGARAALFGRKINNADNQLAFVEFLRLIADGVLEPVEAVKAYHAVLGKLNIEPQRSLDDDLLLTDTSLGYGSGPRVGASAGRARAQRDDRPDFAAMSPAERLEYHLRRLNSLFGER